MKFDIIRMGSRGRIIIPKIMMEGIEGNKLIVIKEKNKLIFKSIKDFEKIIKNEIKLANIFEKKLKSMFRK